uniref:ATP-dependent DNA helicase n=1 Tax=Denticeps clupeoides TaxID=299321 RepID=A0AAY4A1C6_9TELE
MTGLPEKYKARPYLPEFGNMCLAEFASDYRIVYGRQKDGKNVLPLQNDMGFIQKRSRGKPAVIRYARFSPEKNAEKFYGTILKLYLPHWRDSQLKSTRFTTHEAFHAFASVRLMHSETLERVAHIVKVNRKKYEKHSEVIEQAIEDFEQNGPIEDAWTTLAPNNELIRLECVMELESTDPNFEKEQDDIPDFNIVAATNSHAALAIESSELNPAQMRKMYQSLNQTQAAIFYAIRDWCKKIVDGKNPDQFLWYVSGTAGTGKRALLLHEEMDMSQPTVLLTAFTGTAAFNINGKTLHSLLKLPRSLKPPYQGLGNSLDEMRAKLSRVQICILDEISMVSKPLFSYVNWRLQQIKGSKRPFGGISILAVGDFLQLPPLGKARPLCVLEPHILDFWKDSFKVMTLTEIMRQKDDIEVLKMVTRAPEQCPSDALHIFATNKEVDDHNSSIMSSHFTDIVYVHANDYKKDLRSGQMQQQPVPFKGEKSDLNDTLPLAIGARVMLTRNIDVEDGLVNGTFGKVATILTKPHMGESFVAEEPLRKKGTVRRQFPMKLAFACTCHKVQGMTTQCAVVSLKKIFEPGMAYVALSRTTSLSGLHIMDFNEDKIFCDPEHPPHNILCVCRLYVSKQMQSCLSDVVSYPSLSSQHILKNHLQICLLSLPPSPTNITLMS